MEKLELECVKSVYFIAKDQSSIMTSFKELKYNECKKQSGDFCQGTRGKKTNDLVNVKIGLLYLYFNSHGF